MNNQIYQLKLQCELCNQEHDIFINKNVIDNMSEEQKSGKAQILTDFICCPNLATMYNLTSFVLDTRTVELQYNQEIKQDFIKIFGTEDFDNKLKRFTDLDFHFIGIPEEYYRMLKTIVESYSCGYFYPAMTGAGALGERILNRLLFKTKNHYKDSLHYNKDIREKSSLNDWKKMIDILQEWNIISKDIGDMFSTLKKYRNDAIHYNQNYDFANNSKNAIKTLIKIIKKLFDVSERTDIFWTFNSPGEVLVKTVALNNPFVIEFILPNCTLIPPFKESRILKPISDEEFIELRKNGK